MRPFVAPSPVARAPTPVDGHDNREPSTAPAGEGWWPSRVRRGVGAGGLALALALVAGHGAAQAQALSRRPFPRRGSLPEPTADHAAPSGAPADTANADFRGRFGMDVAMRLLRSTDADDRLRGLERAAATRTPEALSLLERAAASGLQGPQLDGIARSDPRALLVVVQGLASWIDREPARAALEAVLRESTQSFTPRNGGAGTGKDPAADEADNLGRVLRARQEAAMALAASGNVSSLEALLAIGRSNGPGQAAALDALAAHPPATALLGGVALTTPPTIALAIEAGDLRSLGAILGAVHASDPALRAAAIAALGVAGDARVLDAAREAGKDKEPRVRVAGADALAHLGAPEAAQAVETLVGDEVTARDGLRIAQNVQAEGVVKAAAARAAASAEPGLRGLALVALGRQTSPTAVTALEALAADPRLTGDALDALARSPSAAAMAAIEAIAAAPATRRVGARAYFVRRMVRGERSPRGDALLEALAASGDGADRAVGLEALVALGERPLDRALEDRDARVRRAAAMAAGALGHAGKRAAVLLAHLAVEPDETTREVMAVGLAAGDPDGAVPTGTLLDRAQAGGPDAPLAALALARRADEELSPKVDALLASHDPWMRAHVARGLGASAAPDAVGRLARAYTWEPSPEVRRTLVEALAVRGGQDAEAPVRRQALELAASLEPDAVTRQAAQWALDGARSPVPPAGHEVAWLRIVAAEGARLPRDMTGTVTGADGMARPIAFDDDGYALVPGLPPGDVQLRLTARVPEESAR